MSKYKKYFFQNLYELFVQCFFFTNEKDKYEVCPIKIVFIQKVQELARVKIAILNKEKISLPKFCLINKLFYGKFLYFIDVKNIRWLIFANITPKIMVKKQILIMNPITNEIKNSFTDHVNNLIIQEYKKSLSKLPIKHLTLTKTIQGTRKFKTDFKLNIGPYLLPLLKMQNIDFVATFANIKDKLRKAGHKIVQIVFFSATNFIFVVDFFCLRTLHYYYDFEVINNHPMAEGITKISDDCPYIFDTDFDLEQDENFQIILDRLKFENKFIKQVITCNLRTDIFVGDFINKMLVFSVKHVINSRKAFSIFTLLEDPEPTQYKCKIEYFNHIGSPNVDVVVNFKKGIVKLRNVSSLNTTKCIINVF